MSSKEIPLANGGYALVSAEDYNRVQGYPWYEHRSGNKLAHRYVAANVYGDGVHHLKMHRLIMDPATGMDVDHINGDGLDNRRSNLRVVTRSQNLQNSRPRKGTRSRFKGVDWVRYGVAGQTRWRARITVNRRSIHLGHFQDEQAAADAYDAAAREYFGAHALTNAEWAKAEMESRKAVA